MGRTRRTLSSLGVVAALAAMSAGAEAAEPPAGPGDPGRGRGLFVGATVLQNGGAACGACHAFSGRGRLLAASLGPDLSQSFEGMPAEAVDGMLQDLPFPTMAPIYAGRALTPQERADLAAFLTAPGGAPPPSANAIAGAAAAIGALLLGLLGVFARRRKPPTRGTLVARPPFRAAPPRTGRRIDPQAASERTVRPAQGGSR